MPVKRASKGANTLRTFLYFLYLMIVVLLLLEVIFRYQLIDFYRSELVNLNDAETLEENNKPVILTFGDSFTVQDSSWLHQMRDTLSDFKIINSAITGSSVIEASYMAPGRIKNLDPDIVIYQIYVGNDLLGIRHFLNWQEWSPQRNIYWWISDYLHVVAYFNYRLGRINWSPGSRLESVTADPSTQEKFDAASYREREKMLASGEPDLINDSALLKNNRGEDMEELSSRISEIVSAVKPGCKIYLLVIPQKAQVNSYYQSTMEEIGFKFDPSFITGKENYPFIEKLKLDFKGNSSVTILNPLTSLRENDSATRRMFYLLDEHLSPAGQSVVKNFVVDAIR